MRYPRISLACLPWRVLLVMAIAFKVRLSWWRSAPGAAYFPDSMCYWPMGGPCASGHSWTVKYLWNFLTNHHMSEYRVLVLQLILGLACSAFVFATLRLLVQPNVALVLAIAFSSIPQIVFMERAILTESVELTLVTFGTFVIVVTMKVRNPWVQALALSIAALTYGLAVSIHAASLIALGMSVAVASIAIALRGRWTIRDSWRCWIVRVALMASLPVLFVAPSIPVLNLHERTFGVWGYSPIANETLVFRWSPIISCDLRPHTTELTRAVVSSACRNSVFFPVPGTNLDPVFDAETQALVREHRNQFALASKEFGSIAMKAIVNHPWVVAREMSRSILWQVSRERQFDQYEPAAAYLNPVVPKKLVFPNWHQWFGVHEPTARSPFPRSLLRSSNENIVLPNHLLWIGVAAVAVRVLLGLLTHRRPLYGWQIKPLRRVELAVLLVALVQLFGLAVAYSSAPDARYWLPFIPTMLILIALGVLAVTKQTPMSIGISETPSDSTPLV